MKQGECSANSSFLCRTEKLELKSGGDLNSSFRQCDTDKTKKKKGGGEYVYHHSLPREMIVEILSRLPVKCMLRFETVCKQWLSLIQNPTFLKLHFDHSNTTDGHTCLFLEDFSSNSSYIYSVNLTNGEDGEGEVEDHPTTFIVKHDLPPHRTTVKSYCKGLLCYYTWFPLKFWVCNLSTRQQIKLPPPRCLDFMDFDIKFGFEFNPSTLGFGFNPSTSSYTVVFYIHRQCHLFTLGAGTGATSSSWRKITSIPAAEHRAPCQKSLCVNGVLYWNLPSLHLLTSFDLGTEEFGVVRYPIDLTKRSQIYEFQGSLCLFYTDDTEGFLNLWVMKDHNNHSWDYHQFILPHPHPLSFWAPRKIFRNWDVAAVINSYKKNDHNGHYDRHRRYLHSYNLLTFATKKVELLGLPPNASIVAIGDCENKNMR